MNLPVMSVNILNQDLVNTNLRGYASILVAVLSRV